MRYALVVLTVALSGCGARSTPGLSDSQATRLLEDQWKLNNMVLPLGEVRIVRSDAAIQRREVLQPATAWYEALKNDGVISLSQQTSLTDGRNFSWNNFYELSQRGVQEKVQVARTPAGAAPYRCGEAMLKALGHADALCVSFGSGKVEEIVKGEQVLIGTRLYHFFMGNYRWKWSPVSIKARTAISEESAEERKFMALAAYDPFLKKWTLDDVDHAPRTGAFSRQKQFDQFLSPMGAPRIVSAAGR